jgi:hypothetical protein
MIQDLADYQRERLDVVRVHLRQKLEEQGVPVHLRNGLVAYVLERREPGRFLRRVLENDLSEAVLRMAPLDSCSLHALVLFLTNHVPAPCWGSPEKVRTWLADPSVPVVGCD